MVHPLSALVSSRIKPVEAWRFLHHAAAPSIPRLNCRWHQGLIAHDEHLARRCPSWNEDQVCRTGWAPEVA